MTSDSLRELQPGDLAFVEDLALRAGAAVESSRLYSERARTAQTLQDSLLPDRLPDLAGSAPRRPTARAAPAPVGGDFYDLFAVGDSVMVLLGDVTGKGVEAAARPRSCAIRRRPRRASTAVRPRCCASSTRSCAR